MRTWNATFRQPVAVACSRSGGEPANSVERSTGESSGRSQNRQNRQTAEVRRLGIPWRTSPGLCFQPGVGWQRIPPGPPDGSAAGTQMAPAEVSSQSAIDRCKVIEREASAPGRVWRQLPAKKELGAGVREVRNPQSQPRASDPPGRRNPALSLHFQVNSPLPSEWQCRPELDEDHAERHATCPHAFCVRSWTGRALRPGGRSRISRLHKFHQATQIDTKCA